MSYPVETIIFIFLLLSYDLAIPVLSDAESQLQRAVRCIRPTPARVPEALCAVRAAACNESSGNPLESGGPRKRS